MARQNPSLTSMTGFARVAGGWADVSWVWELKSVNGKALDLRFRLPLGFDAIEGPARAAAGQKLKRGNVQINLLVQDGKAAETLVVNRLLLERLVALAEELRDRLGSAPIQAEQLLGLRGVLEMSTQASSEEDLQARDMAVLQDFEKALTLLAASRLEEGQRLGAVVSAQLQRITELTEAARLSPARQPEAIGKRLAEQIARVMEQGTNFDPQRLHQEAILVATRADVQEELDRLTSHLAAAALLMQADEPVGRKFDFLTQEFNREANTLCSKALDGALTSIGLDLKTVIDQMREQVQNIE